MERYQGKPFALLGVNTDNSPKKVIALQNEGKVTWRSFCNGADEIISAYGVQAIPTVVLIDHKGIVRAAWVGPDPAVLDKKLEELVAAAEVGN